MMHRRWVCVVIAALGLHGCTHSVHINHTSDYRLTKPLSDHRVVEAQGEQTVILGFVKTTDYVDGAFDSLKSACPDGTLTGIQTRYSTSHNFLSWKNIIELKGYCSQ